MHLSGVKVKSASDVSTIIRDAVKKQAAIHDYWAKQFLAQPTSDAAQSELLERHGRRWDVSELRPPDTATYRTYLMHRGRSAPGPDGIPYPALLNSTVIEAIAEVAGLYYQGILPYRAMAYSSLVTPPKGQDDHDNIEVIRTPENLRPLSGRNADAKAIAGGMALQMNPFLSRQAPPEQRGFIKRRQFTDNIVELDAHMV